MDINDSGKDTLIDKATENIDRDITYLINNHSLLTVEERRERKERIIMMSINREKLLESKINRTFRRMPSYRDPRPQTQDEIQELYRLIDSVV